MQRAAVRRSWRHSGQHARQIDWMMTWCSSSLRSPWLHFAGRVGLAELVERDQANTHRVERGLHATLDPQLAQDAAHVGLDGLLGDSQVATDLLIGQAACQQLQHLRLALREHLRALWCDYLLHEPRSGLR